MVSFRTKRQLVRLRRIVKLWPWAISVIFHIAILAILSTVVFISFSTKDDKKEIIPEARLGKINTQLPLFQKLETRIKDVQEKELKKQIRKSLKLTGEPKSDTGKKLSVIGIEGQEAIKLPGCDLARLQPSAPVTKFFSARGNAYNIVYLVDRSASMIDTIEPLKRELKRSIDILEPMQKFEIIFFSSGKPIEGPGKALVWATTKNKERYKRFIDSIHAEGQTDPQWALQRALQLKPDLIYLLTDGVFSEQIAKKIIKWANAYHVKINTIAYLREIGSKRLMEIAEQTGGVFRFVTEEQLE